MKNRISMGGKSLLPLRGGSYWDSYQLKRAIFGEYSESEWAEGWFYLQRDSALIEAKKNEAGK